MSISQNEGLQAAAKAVAAVEPRQNQDKNQVEERQYDNPDKGDVQSSNSKAYVVNLTDEAVKRSGDANESYTGERGGEAVARAESKEPGRVPEEVKSAQVERPKVESSFVEPGKVEHEIKSATDEGSVHGPAV